MRRCQECNGTFSMSETHSCVSYLSRLMKTIVGETAYDRAIKVLENQPDRFQNKNKGTVKFTPPPALGTLEEYFLDSIEGIKTKLFAQQEQLSRYMQ